MTEAKTTSSIMKDVRTPTFACYMRANPFSKEKADYLRQHEKRMQEFSNRPYLKHVYPCIPAHYPGTWRVYNWEQIDSVVDRLYYVPERWTQDFQRREEMRELVAKQIAGPAGLQGKPGGGSSTKTFTAPSKPRAASAPAAGRRVDENGLLLKPPEKREYRRADNQRGMSATSMRADNQRGMSATSMRADNQRGMSAKSMRANLKSSLAETAWGYPTSVPPSFDSSSLKQRRTDANHNQDTISAFTGNSGSHHTHTVEGSQAMPVMKPGVRFTETGRVNSADVLELPQVSPVLHPSRQVHAQGAHSEYSHKRVAQEDNVSLASRPKSAISAKSERQMWSFHYDEAESVTSSVMALLQQIHATNGRIRPSSAMVSYRERQRHQQDQLIEEE